VTFTVFSFSFDSLFRHAACAAFFSFIRKELLLMRHPLRGVLPGTTGCPGDMEMERKQLPVGQGIIAILKFILECHTKIKRPSAVSSVGRTNDN
jgi:hypothetical protein